MIDSITKKWIKSQADEWAVEEGCIFNERRVEHVVNFFSRFLCHSKGEFAGKPFNLLDYQYNDIIAPLFGWEKPDKTRRYRRAYVEIPKKNGKSTMCSGIALYLLVGDKEAGAEIYSAAGEREQARIVFNEAVNMIEASPVLKKNLFVKDSRNMVLFPKTKSRYKALSADAKTKEGFNIHGLIFDELHTQPNRNLWSALRYGGASRKQPLFISITTAGEDFTSVCWEQHRYAEGVIKGETRDSEFLGVIYGALPTDDIASPEVWKKANPSLGITISYDDMKSAYNDAKHNPMQMTDFLRYRLNIWGIRDVRWLEMDAWEGCANLQVEKPYQGQKCYVGIDLATTTDMAALTAYFPDTHYVDPYFWCPERAMDKRNREKRTSYDYWAKMGHVEVASGPVIDYDLVRKRLDILRSKFDLLEIAIDPLNATEFALSLINDGFNVYFYRQSFGQMSPAMKEVERLILEGKLVHHNNPVLKWMMGSIAPEKDSHGNIRPSKKNSRDSIDGIVALIMAVGRSMINKQKESVYAIRGIRST